ncbi:hypothetical protein [Pseudomarimonas arenosa]|uniref:Uncharacterized protein n=1 Tax=Pseudomarimonas arenosa TaxID=2774145 RepID=A0AAW3ZPJ0_9GAMM|nr:hypothetical protein [Pseudomarimonas arenosa]MBD8527633.1 hypothetical protein [Pseudomarimonas arenosa]
MSWMSGCALGLAVAIVVINLLYSGLMAWLFHLREGHWPDSFPLGIPLIGTLAVLAAVGLGDGLWHPYLVTALIVFDTGGPLAATLHAAQQRRRQSRRRQSLAIAPRVRERHS